MKRPDGRNPEDLRDTIRIEAGVLDRADGSAYLEWGTTIRLVKTEKDDKDISSLEEEYLAVKTIREEGNYKYVEVPKPLWKEIEGYEVIDEYLKGNKVYVAVYGPREPIPRHEASPYKAILRYRYTMSPFSVPERKSPKPGRREIEISMVSRMALESILFLEEFPMTTIDVFAEVISADAGTRVAALTAAGVALADAGIPMKDIPVALAVGKIGNTEEDATIVVDLNKFEEDMPFAVDMPLVIVPRREEITLLQMDGRLKKGDVEEMLELAIKKGKELNKIQREALIRKYERVDSHE